MRMLQMRCVNKLSKCIVCALALALGGFGAGPVSAHLISNGDFETWSGGDPVGWTLVNEVIATQIDSWDETSAVQLGRDRGSLDRMQQSFSAHYSFELSYEFAQLDPGNPRGMHASLRDSAGNYVINWIAQGNNLRFYDGSAWNVVVGTENKILNSDTLTPDDFAVYRLTIVGQLAGPNPSYLVSLYDVNNDESIISDVSLNHFHGETDDGVSILTLERRWSGADWAADNVTLIPEPGTLSVLLLGLLGVFIARRRIH